MPSELPHRKNNAPLGRGQPITVFFLVFIACYVLCAVVFQAFSSIPPWHEGTPMEFFTQGLLWMLSLSCLLIASHDTSSKFKTVFWMASCAALFALAIDERFAYHERTETMGLFNDDYFKVIIWIATAFVLRFIVRISDPLSMARRALFIGYVFHSLYILVELGDGEFFKLPFASVDSLKWSEEFFELFFLSSYLTGFIFIHLNNRDPRYAE